MGDTPNLNEADFERWWSETGERELKIVLHWRWDPIGVVGAYPAAEDEYDSYARPVVELLHASQDSAAVTDFLGQIEEERMGLGKGGGAEREATAEFVCGWYRQSVFRWQRLGARKR